MPRNHNKVAVDGHKVRMALDAADITLKEASFMMGYCNSYLATVLPLYGKKELPWKSVIALQHVLNCKIDDIRYVPPLITADDVIDTAAEVVEVTAETVSTADSAKLDEMITLLKVIHEDLKGLKSLWS